MWILRAPWCNKQYNKFRGIFNSFSLRLVISGGGINPDFSRPRNHGSICIDKPVNDPSNRASQNLPKGKKITHRCNFSKSRYGAWEVVSYRTRCGYSERYGMRLPGSHRVYTPSSAPLRLESSLTSSSSSQSISSSLFTFQSQGAGSPCNCSLM